MSLHRIQDQTVALRLLRGIIARNRLPNGLLFWGPHGVGKHQTALEFAKAVNCRESEDDACDKCLSCRKTENSNHGDVIKIAPTGKMRIIKTEVIDDINETSAYRPFEGGRRVVIFEEADRMNESAQNHFLKTLEEPPSQTFFILITAAPRFLLPTIRSRCQGVRFGALREETIRKLLAEQSDLNPSQAEAIAALAQGSMARALDLIHSERRQVTLDIIRRLTAREDPLLVNDLFVAHIQTTRKAIEERVKTQFQEQYSENPEDDAGPDKEAIEAQTAGLVRQELLDYLLLFDAWYRDQMIQTVAENNKLLFNRDKLSALAETPITHEKQLVKLEAINIAGKYIKRNMNPNRVFRDLFFALAS